MLELYHSQEHDLPRFSICKITDAIKSLKLNNELITTWTGRYFLLQKILALVDRNREQKK